MQSIDRFCIILPDVLLFISLRKICRIQCFKPYKYGTHTGIWRSPNGAEVPPTGKKLDFPFVGVFRVENGKISSIRLHYDQVEVLTQLGLMPGATSG